MDQIDALDRALKRSGFKITLRKVSGTTSQTFTDLLNVPAMVRGYSPQEIVAGGGIIQTDSHVIISPTQINLATWPFVQGTGADVRIPSRNRGDLCSINGVWRTVVAGVGLYMGSDLVRIEMQVR